MAQREIVIQVRVRGFWAVRLAGMLAPLINRLPESARLRIMRAALRPLHVQVYQRGRWRRIGPLRMEITR